MNFKLENSNADEQIGQKCNKKG